MADQPQDPNTLAPGTTQVAECDACHYTTTVTVYRQNRMPSIGHKQLCHICASTMLGVAYEYQYAPSHLCSALGWIGNYLADLVAGKVTRD